MYVKISCSIPVFNEKGYILRIAGYSINFIIWSQWCKGRLICSLHVSVQ